MVIQVKDPGFSHLMRKSEKNFSTVTTSPPLRIEKGNTGLDAGGICRGALPKFSIRGGTLSLLHQDMPMKR